ncbi:DUF7365 family protein [Streptococcus sciuri]|uniref:DUF7365 domain-containing protein n=1 Tax=Streptococcus sciuri TaxID=2973939 RepID=A0ABT2F7I3_9STRE|nr:hypothetical protein [Streptococcus sciuri]MCS4488369.1 hypothetical protein [Streptococcus sciuri]
MAERELMHWLVVVVLPIVVSGTSLALLIRGNMARLEHRLTNLEAECKYQREKLSDHAIVLDKYGNEQKAMMAMIEQIKHLSENMKEVRSDIKTINEKLQEGYHAH